MKYLLAVLSLGLLMTVSTSGQWRGAIQVGTLVDDNAFNNYLQIRDVQTEFSLQGGYDWESASSNTQIFYAGLLNYYSRIPSRTFQVHDAGLAYSHFYGEDQGSELNAGATFTVRDNHEEYAVYDHTELGIYGNLRGYLSDLLLVKGGYTFRSVAFSELSDFDYREHSMFVGGTITLPTTTTIHLQADLGFKQYATPNADTSAMSVSGYGRRRKSSNESTPGVTQLIGMIRLGQGITERTGISLTGQYQWSLQQETRYMTFEDGVLTDDDLFDDHYGYEGPLVSLMVTQLLPADFRARVSGSIQERRYSNRPAFDLPGNQIAPQRLDSRTAFSVSFDRTFHSLGLRGSLVYDHIINASNDVFYNYHNDAISFRLSFLY